MLYTLLRALIFQKWWMCKHNLLKGEDEYGQDSAWVCLGFLAFEYPQPKPGTDPWGGILKSKYSFQTVTYAECVGLCWGNKGGTVHAPPKIAFLAPLALEQEQRLACHRTCSCQQFSPESMHLACKISTLHPHTEQAGLWHVTWQTARFCSL